MARFCTQCGSAADADSKFCAECGTPYTTLIVPPAAARPAGAAPRSARRALLIGGSVVALLVAGGGAAYLLADQQATPEVFADAITSYYAANKQAADQLLCFGGLPLNANPVRLSGFDGEQRALMDELALAGLFAPAVQQSSGGYFATPVYSYQRTEAGSSVIRNGRLCVAPAVSIKNVRFAPDPAASQLVAHFQYEFERPQAWLTGGLARWAGKRLAQQDEQLAVMELRDRKWIMVSDNPRTARAVASGFSKAAAAPSLLERMQGWFRTGNPLIGKWRIVNTPWLDNLVVTFADTHASVGRPDEAVTYEIKGQRVTVHYTERGASDVFVIGDERHISVESDGVSVQFERIKE